MAATERRLFACRHLVSEVHRNCGLGKSGIWRGGLVILELAMQSRRIQDSSQAPVIKSARKELHEMATAAFTFRKFFQSQ